jgi:predicted porin
MDSTRVACRTVRSFPTAVAAACLLWAGSAAAQSSAVLYGRVIGGVGYVNRVATGNGGSAGLFRYGGDWGASWWGIRVNEDLGQGLSAVVNLESMFSSDDGRTIGDSFFNRYAIVGLASRSYGSVWLGRAMALTDGELWAVDPFAMQFTGLGTLAYGRNWGPRSNAITYNSPSWGGLSFRAQAGLGEVPGRPSGGRQLSVSVSYESGPLVLKGVYEEIRDANGDFTNLYATSREYAVGGAYQAGDVKLFAGYSLIRSGSDTVADASNPTAANRHQMVWLGAAWSATPSLTLLAGAYHASLNRDGGNATLLALGANYYLSKRTLLYATVGTVMNRGNAAFSVEVTADTKPVAGATQQGVYTGIMHSF